MRARTLAAAWRHLVNRNVTRQPHHAVAISQHLAALMSSAFDPYADLRGKGEGVIPPEVGPDKFEERPWRL